MGDKETKVGEILRGNTSGGTKSLREEIFLRGGLQEELRKTPRGTLVMKTKSQKGTSLRFSEVLSETPLEEDFLSETLGPVAPNRAAP